MVTCAYDSMGRRSYKQVTVNGTVTLHQRYLYRGYLQIACIDLTRSHHPGLWLITWDPTQSPRGLGGGLDKPRSEFAPQGRGGNGVPTSQPIATRPLTIQKDGTWYTYGLDLTKNVCEVFGSTGYIATSYTYSPYGSVTVTGSVTQPIQWSSEVWDNELGMVYYNWRYYKVKTANWNSRDRVENTNLYYLQNPILFTDIMGLAPNINLHKTEDVDAKTGAIINYYEILENTTNEPEHFVIVAHGKLCKIAKRTFSESNFKNTLFTLLQYVNYQEKRSLCQLRYTLSA